MEDYNQKNTEREPNTFTIYQLKDGEALHYHRFEPLERLEKSGLSGPMSILWTQKVESSC